MGRQILMAKNEVGMKPIRVDDTSADIALSLDEMRLLCNALNEVCNGIEIYEFETRLGATRADAEALMSELGHLQNLSEGHRE
jgi:hypothetical protein